MYIGCMTSGEVIEKILCGALAEAGVTIPQERFPLIVRGGENDLGRRVTYYLNYSGETVKTACAGGTELLSGAALAGSAQIEIAPWNLAIIEEN